MSIEIGTIKTIVGKFWIQNPNGEMHLAVIGEMIHEGDRIVGGSGNTSNSTFSIDLVGNIDQDIAVGANEILTLDRTFMLNVLGIKDVGSNQAPLVAAWEGPSEQLSIQIEDTKDAMALADTEIEDGETAAGGAATDAQIAPANFDERTGAFGNVSTDLLDPVSTETGTTLTGADTFNPNDAPTPQNDNATGAEGDTLTTPEDTQLIIATSTLLSNDTDPDGDTLTITSVQGAVNGTVALVGGNIVFTPTENYNGPASFTYTVSDGNGGTASATVNVGVTPVNDGPTIDVTAVAALNENDAVVGTKVADFTASDEEDGTPTVTFTAGTNVAGYYAISGNTVVLTQAGVNAVNAGTTLPEVNLTATDSGNLTDTDSDTPTYNAQNDGPTIDVTANDFTEDAVVLTAGVSKAGTYTTFDEEGNAVTVSFNTASTHYTLDQNGNVFLTQAGINVINAGGTLDKIDLKVTENGDPTKSSTGSDTPVVTPVNDVPTLLVNTGNPDNGNDNVSESALSIGTNPSSIAEFAYGQFTIGDADGLSDITSITLGTTVFTVGAGGLVGLIGSSITTTNGTVTLMGYDNGTFDYRYELKTRTTDIANQTERDSFTVQISDFAGASSPQLTVTVDILDDAPTLLAPDSIYILDHATSPDITRNLNFVAGADGVGNVILNFTDGDIATDSAGNQLSFNGELLYYRYAGDDKTVLIASTAQTGLVTKLSSTTAFWLDINPVGNTYTMHSNGIIQNGTGVTSTPGDVVNPGNVKFVVMTDLGATNKDAIITGSSTINTNANTIGIGSGQNFTYNEATNNKPLSYDGIRVDFVNGAAYIDQGTSSKNDDSYSYSSGTDHHYSTNGYSQRVYVSGDTTGDVTNTANITITAIVADADSIMYAQSNKESEESYLDLSAANIKVYNGTVLVSQSANPTATTYSVTENLDGSVTLKGIRDGWTFQVLTGDNTFSAIQVDAAADTDAFKLDYFTIGTDYSGDPVDINFNILGTDGDGDPVSGIINTTLYPNSGRTLSGADDVNDTLNSTDTGQYVVAGSGNDTLYGNGGDDVLIGDIGVDKLYGGAGNDTLISDIHTNGNGTLNMTTDSGAGAIDGGAGIDTLILGKDGNNIDFSALNNGTPESIVIKNIEIIDLEKGGSLDNHSLTNLTLADVIQMTDANNTLTIKGDDFDSVSVLNTGTAIWSKVGVVDGFDIYENSEGDGVTLKIETTINDTIIH